MSLRIVFMGTPDFACPLLLELIGQGHDIAACYTRAPRPGGRRGLEPVKSPVHRAAEQAGIPVRTPASLRDAQAQAEFRDLEADVGVVVAYGLILPRPVLEAPRLGCLNLHASLLPRWRGAAPIQRAIMAGDAQTGVMAMQMDEGLDTGPVAMAETIAIGPDMTAGDLHDALAPLGADLMTRALAALERGTLTFHPQDAAGATYADKIRKEECRIDWTQDAASVHNRLRGLSPFPGAFFETDLGRGPERIKALRSSLRGDNGMPLTAPAGASPGQIVDEFLTVACGSGAVRLTQVQRAGKAPVGARDFLNGAPVRAGHRLA